MELKLDETVIWRARMSEVGDIRLSEIRNMRLVLINRWLVSSGGGGGGERNRLMVLVLLVLVLALVPML